MVNNTEGNAFYPHSLEYPNPPPPPRALDHQVVPCSLQQILPPMVRYRNAHGPSQDEASKPITDLPNSKPTISFAETKRMMSDTSMTPLPVCSASSPSPEIH